MFISSKASLIFLQANSVLTGFPSKTITEFKGSSRGGVPEGVRGDKAAEEAVVAGVHGARKDGELGGLGVLEGVRGGEAAEEAVIAGAHRDLSRKTGELGGLAFDRGKDSSLSDKRLNILETFTL